MAKATPAPKTMPAALAAAQLAPLVNAFTIAPRPPKTITIPNASQLAQLQDVTVSGKLLNKQVVKLDTKTNRRAVKVVGSGAYVKQEADGDLHFALGARQGQPHIACELQNAAAWIKTFNGVRGQAITVTGFFRCLFEHPGFQGTDDAHVFEIHPVRAVTLGGSTQAFNVDVPNQQKTHTWKQPHDLNLQDGAIPVRYDRGKDVLTFQGMDGQDENYVWEVGTVSNLRPSATPPAPSRFTFDSPDIGHPIEAVVLHGTAAARQLSQLPSPRVKLVALRNIDLQQALLGRYVINLLAIDLGPSRARR